MEFACHTWGFHDRTLGNALGTIARMGFRYVDLGTGPHLELNRIAQDPRGVAATGQRAVIVSSLPETMSETVRERLKSAGITPMQGIEDCLFAIRAAATVGAAQARAADIRPVMAFMPAAGEPVLLDEWQSKAELAAAGVAIPAGRLCSAAELQEAAALIGYPLVLKGVAEGLAHKSEAGAVIVGIRNERELAAAAVQFAGRFERLLVEAQAGPTVAELIVGVSRDPVFGLTLLIGSGGVHVELIDDTVSLLLPVSRADIVAALGRLKAAKLIAGFRGAAAGDFDAAVAAVESVAAYALGHADRLAELDVNPLIVTPTAAVAADALIRACP